MVRARNPKLSDYKFGRNKRKPGKIQELYPTIYRASRNMDIAIIYGTMG